MSEYKELSLEKWELDYILEKLGKRETAKNRDLLRKWEIKFKIIHNGTRTKKYTKDDFYNWLKSQDLSLLE